MVIVLITNNYIIQELFMKDIHELVDYLIKKSTIKATKAHFKVAMMAFMAGAMIALGAVGNIVVSADLIETNAGIAKFAGAAVFPVGLIAIVMIGYDLFTSNCLNIVSAFEKQISYVKFFENLIFVLFFNFIGCLFIGYITSKTGTFSEAGKTLLYHMAEHKVHASSYDIFLKGILCNVLVCGACLIGYGSKDAAGKIFGIWFPIMLFIVLGYDHIVANMLYLPTAYMLNAPISISEIAHNFLFAGIGNFIGGVVFILLPVYLVGKSHGEQNAKN